MLVIVKYHSIHEHKHLEWSFTLARYSLNKTAVVNIQCAHAKRPDRRALILLLSQ